MDGIDHLRAQFGRGDPGQFANLASQMSLVEVAAAWAAAAQSIAGSDLASAVTPLEPNNPRDELRRQPDGIAVARDQPPVTPPELVGQPADHRHAAAGVDAARATRRRRRRRAGPRRAAPVNASSTNANRVGQSGASPTRCTRSRPKGPSTSSIGTETLASSSIGMPTSRRAPSGVRSTCRQRADPSWPTSTGPSVMPATNDPSRSGRACLPVRHRPARVEVDDDRDECARQLADRRRIHRPCVEPLVAQHHTAK